MAQVQLTVTFNISPGSSSNPLTVTPTSATVSGTVGQPLSSTPVAQVTGGVPPDNITVDASSPNQLPPGVTPNIDSSGNVTFSGTPTAAGSGTVVLDITDSDTSTSTSSAAAMFRRR